jgi:RecA/RadA recombinase
MVSVTVAPGGLGKSTIITAEAVAMTTGQSFLGRHTDARKCWLWNLEDPIDEIYRKVYAIAQHYELTQADIADRLLINSGRDEPLILAQTIGGHNLLTPVADQLTEHIKANKIDCVIVDPFVSSHQLSENDNVAIDMVVKRWSQVASDSNCAIHLVHHVRKDNGMGGASVADARGASALVDAARFVRRLQRMTADEARNAGIDEDQFWRYTREGDSKNNLSPPSADSTWRKLISIELPNGDSVGVAEPWQWPDAFSDVTRNDLEAVQRKVAAGEYRENARAKDWVGQAVADTMNLDIKDSYVRAKVRHMVSTWIANDALRIVERPDRTRMMRKFVVVGRWVREGEVDE